MCGGYRETISEHLIAEGYSPRVRGLSVVLSTVTRWLEVFPPCAGVIGRVVHGYPLAGSIPPACGGYRNISGNPLRRILPACGGYRSSSRNSDRQCRYSPRVRGLSVNVLLIYECGDVFPPDCGGYRSKSKIRLIEKWVSPPAYGGYRHEPAHSDAHLLYSPRMRGLSADPVPRRTG